MGCDEGCPIASHAAYVVLTKASFRLSAPAPSPCPTVVVRWARVSPLLGCLITSTGHTPLFGLSGVLGYLSRKKCYSKKGGE